MSASPNQLRLLLRLLLVILAIVLFVQLIVNYVWKKKCIDGLIKSFPAHQRFHSLPHGPDWCYFPNVVKSEQRTDRITMVLHTSANYFGNNLLHMANKWDGRISLSVQSSSSFNSTKENDSSVENTITKIYSMFHCFPSLKESLSAHVFFKRNDGNRCPSIEVYFPSEVNCTAIAKTKLKPFYFDTDSEAYPVNTARNIARMNSESDYILFADMEQEYSQGAEMKLRQLTKVLDFQKHNVVYVVRRFEYSKEIKAPRTLTALSEALTSFDAYEFHHFLYKQGHTIPKLNQWLRYKNNSMIDIIDIRYSDQKGWEPMFLSHRSIPFHDEQIPYGMNNNVAMAYHLCCAGYQFAVAPEVFNVHKGIRSANDTRKLNRRTMDVGYASLKNFYIRMAKQYPTRAKSCLKRRYIPPY